jgi:cell division protein FtsL
MIIVYLHTVPAFDPLFSNTLGNALPVLYTEICITALMLTGPMVSTACHVYSFQSKL